MTYDYVIKMPPKREYIIRGRIIKRLKGKSTLEKRGLKNDFTTRRC